MRNCSRDASSSKRQPRRLFQFWEWLCLDQLFSLPAKEMNHQGVAVQADAVIPAPEVVMTHALATASQIAHGAVATIVEVIQDLTNPIPKLKKASRSLSLKLS